MPRRESLHSKLQFGKPIDHQVPFGFVIAGQGAPEKIIASADYMALGANDENDFQDAISRLPTAGGTIFAVGTFQLTNAITVNKQGVSIIGLTRGARFNRDNANPCIVLQANGCAVLDVDTDSGGVSITGANCYARYWRNGIRTYIDPHATTHAPGGNDDLSGSYIKKTGDTIQPSVDGANILQVLTSGGTAVLRADTSPMRTFTLGRLVWTNAAVTLANGNNNNVDIGDAIAAFISGPTAAFAITGLANPEPGRIVILYNTTGQTMTLKNDNTGSTAANRILTPAGTDLSAKAALLIYHGSVSRWRVVLYI